VAAAGLLDDKKATTHWYYLKDLLAEHSSIQYVRDRRLVADRGVASTTGITASMPMTLTLIEAIAGRDKAQTTANELGLSGWHARHSSAAFKFTRAFALTAIANALAIWGHEKLGLALAPGVDEVSLALMADAWSRTYRSRALTFAATDRVVDSRNGMRIFPDEIARTWPAGQLLPPIGRKPAAEKLEEALQAIAERDGARTSDFVAMQLECPRQRSSP
jgi:transcriptional regulator GlxA family with amidase domain